MDHRRAHSAQARVYTPPLNPPPGAQPPRMQPMASPGLLNPSGHPTYRERTLSASSADFYASNHATSSQSTYPRHGQGTPGQPPAMFTFPEPQLYRSTSTGSFNPRKYQRQDTITPDSPGYGDPSAFSDEFFDRDEYAASVTSLEHSPSLRGEAFAQLSLDQDAIKKFQQGMLQENDQEWHRLVDPEARSALPDKEVFLAPLVQAQPPIIPADRIDAFVREVFWNLDSILDHHQRLVAALFDRQRDQHPIIQSVSDVILAATLAFTEDYEIYIKHYPLAEARHRREMRRNPAYQAFLSKCTTDKRTRKRDLITFISRPVTRLPRLKLILETVYKHTDPDHPDHETLPVILEILSDFLKSTQPGIAAAESRVKFVTFCENVVFKRGELIDMDLYGENRTMVHMDTVGRKDKSDTGYGSWGDYTAVLLDHYFILTREEKRGEITRYYVISRPIPLDFLRLGPFIGPPESRRESAENGGFLSLNSIFGESRPMYPFVIADASSETRRYTLFASSERERTKWKEMFEETMSLRAAWVDANRLFAFNPLSDGFMREQTVLVPSSLKKNLPGPMVTATMFTIGGRTYLAVGTQTGVYVGFREDASAFSRVLQLPKITVMAALPRHDRLILLVNGSLVSYSLQTLVNVATSRAPPGSLDKTLVKLAPKHSGQIHFFRVGKAAGRDILAYDSRSFGSSTIHTMEVRLDGLKATNKKGAYLPGVATDLQFLTKHLAIVSDRGMTILDPFEIANVLTVPEFSKANTSEPMAELKVKCDASRTLGIVPVPNGELLCIYDEYGCYINKHGEPIRKCGFVRWEVKAANFIFRAPHILLFGGNFVEVRHAPTGQFKQMLERKSINLLEQTGLSSDSGEFFVSWKGEHNDERGQSQALVEVLETRELSPLVANLERVSLERNTSAVSAAPIANPLWDEFN
ncbi:hypothetical protein M408DRAFT_14127 [Serendipita vermifera MAFF 305830]|uniref:DH domain-containing protein n=1 Tax=Serendipita vermifera MAFF 305830 TaxID=933852 RepID=A0A0C3BML5_SERVB|nr:hypothetical protein M408DRAFT_14127 [Serendipita vermifera MAFF 305830]